MLEVAARPIGGLCSRVLRFEPGVGRRWKKLSCATRWAKMSRDSGWRRGAHGVMMIPIPRAGVYAGVEGVEGARRESPVSKTS